jgi:hypothetical protein
MIFQNSFFNKVALMTAFLLLFGLLTLQAQCPMCRMAAETNLNDGGTMAAGLNKGIIYLLLIPYLLVSCIGFLWWRNQRKIQEQEQEDEIRSLLEPYDVVISNAEFNETVES